MIHFQTHTDSTNRIAREMVAAGAPAGTVVVAGSQSAGRGQYGRAFNSPPGGLYFSSIVEPPLPVIKIPLVTLATGVACRRVLHDNFDIQPMLKWPNDLFLSTKKVAGILCESISRQHRDPARVKVIVGVGLNVNSTIEQFDPEIRPLVTTLQEELGYPVDLKNLLHQILSAIDKNVKDLSVNHRTVLDEWQRYDMLLHKPVKYLIENGQIKGVGHGLTPEGYYRICDYAGQEHTVIGGQLRLVSPQ